MRRDNRSRSNHSVRPEKARGQLRKLRVICDAHPAAIQQMGARAVNNMLAAQWGPIAFNWLKKCGIDKYQSPTEFLLALQGLDPGVRCEFD